VAGCEFIGNILLIILSGIVAGMLSGFIGISGPVIFVPVLFLSGQGLLESFPGAGKISVSVVLQ
jgi:uncharacterized membrane protein YfcA